MTRGGLRKLGVSNPNRWVSLAIKRATAANCIVVEVLMATA